jgi:hypothetical protein
LLACAPGELHDLGLVAFGLALRGRGWGIAFLGADADPGSIVVATSHPRLRNSVKAARARSNTAREQHRPHEAFERD